MKEDKDLSMTPLRKARKIRANLFGGAVFLFLCILAALSSAQSPQDSQVVRVETYVSHEHIRPGDTFQVAIVANIKKGLHINSHQPTDEVLVPTVVSFDERDGIVLAPVSYPEPVLKSFSFSGHKIPVYDGRIVMIVRGKLARDIEPGATKISGYFCYQACDDKCCLMPQSVGFEVPLEVVKADQPAKLTKHAVFEQEISLTSEERHVKKVIEKGLPYALIAFFLFGLALNLTPCVYPVIPMTVGFFVAQGEQKKRAMFLLASYYVLGIAIVFSALGLISGLAGRQWGFLFQHPWFVIIISIIILCMAASMFGAFEITVPSFLMTRLGKSRQGAIGSFLMGLTVGVVIAPCAAGIIIGLVGVVAKLGIVAKGALLFFVMGLGLGLPYLFLATFSGLMKQLPKSGMWMVWIRKVFGLLLIGAAVYFLVPQAKQVANQQGFYFGVLGIFGGLLLGFLEHGEGYSRAFRVIRAALGIVLIVSGAMLVQAAIQPESPGIGWVNHEDRSIEDLQKENKPLLIHFYADWCAACRELEHKTFNDKRVVEKTKEFNMLKVNCTTPEKESAALLKRFNVSGLPTMVFMNPKGERLQSLRTLGFIGPVELTKRMEAAARATGSAK
ncbi:MAG: thioredoxin fold domain-containing protein [Deltaproteobacteria bacterium]|nr:thioredoxin fold domain-containing protein [Deltaproteobacteria bacterium]